ncbi:MAG: hypothetical protein AB4041_20655 [Microcystaceae cyanobacterium]
MDMASEQQVKHYLAYWFLLGKKVVIPLQDQTICPKLVYDGEKYSSEFEQCWQTITLPRHKDSYLEGTTQTIQELLSSKWDITECANCKMPVPMIILGTQALGCPCFDLPSWPNDELPTPKVPSNNKNQLLRIRQKLARWHNDEGD